MCTCIPSRGVKRSWHLCPRRVNAGNKNTPSMHHPRRRNVTTSMVGLKNGHVRKTLTQNGEPQRCTAGECRRRRSFASLVHPSFTPPPPPPSHPHTTLPPTLRCSRSSHSSDLKTGILLASQLARRLALLHECEDWLVRVSILSG